jgi:hypothetical protein
MLSLHLLLCLLIDRFTVFYLLNKSRDSSVGVVLGYRLYYMGSRFRFSAGAGSFSLRHRVRTGTGARPASYLKGTRGSFPAGKAAGA